METINIITRCTRQNNLLEISKTIFNTDSIAINWFIIFDTNIIKDVDAELLSQLNLLKNTYLSFIKGNPDDYGYTLINNLIKSIKKGWIYILDDDNIIHEEFYKEIYKIFEIIEEENLDKEIIVFNQDVNKLDFTGLETRIASKENLKIGGIDVAQFLTKRTIFDNHNFGTGYRGDGIFIEKIYPLLNSKFLFSEKILCYYNYFDRLKPKQYSLPRILLIGVEEKLNLQSNQLAKYESKELNVKQCLTDDNIDEILQTFNPDAIITIGKSFSDFQRLSNSSYDVRSRWIHLDSIRDDLGDLAYRVASNYIFKSNETDEQNKLVSFFSPIYNTGDKLLRTYKSLKQQTYINWEWVIVNDSTDGGKTLKIAEEIAKNDIRVKLYDFRKKSGGIIGESKYRAAALASGDYLVELDHDDYALPDAAYWIVEAFKKYPDTKFVYTDFAEILEDHRSLVYDEGFCFGYGKYKEEIYNNIKYKAVVAPNINPKTIRHIVGVPNHFRAWDRKFYHSIGGHNRRLSIADDYELIVRTFLKTKMVRIPKMLYLQFYHNNNTQNSTREDIQRRVRTISEYYNKDIKNRFIELNKKDWAYDFNEYNPLEAESKFGEEENYVNYIFEETKPNKPTDFNYDNNLGYIL